MLLYGRKKVAVSRMKKSELMRLLDEKPIKINPAGKSPP